MARSLKKILTLSMAVVMVLSLSVSAFAATLADIGKTPVAPDGVLDSGAGTANVPGDVVVKEPIIKVKVPTKLDFTLNPYNVQNAGQVVAPRLEIQNYSECAINMSISKCEVKNVVGDIKMAATAPIATTATKSAYLFMHVAPTVAEFANITKHTLPTLTAPGDVLVKDTGLSDPLKKNLVYVFGPATYQYNASGVPDTTEANIKLSTTGKAFLSVVGSLAPNPTAPWADTDVATLDMVFHFDPSR